MEQPRRRARTELEHRGKGVLVVRGPLARPSPPPELAAAGDVAQTGGTIPGRPHVPLHVRVVGEHLALAVESDVELVAIARAQDLDVPAVRIAAGDPPAGRELPARVTARVPDPRQEQVLLPVGGSPRAVEGGRPDVVAADEVQPLTILGREDGVRAVLASVAEVDEVLGAIELVVAVRVRDAPDPLAVHVHVERLEGPAHPLRAAHVDRDALDVRHRTRLSAIGGRGGRDPEEPALSLVAGVQPAAAVRRQRDPRPLELVRNRVEELGREAVAQAQTLRDHRLLGAAGLRGAHPPPTSGEAPRRDSTAPRQPVLADGADHRRVRPAAPVGALGERRLPGGVGHDRPPAAQIEAHGQGRGAGLVARAHLERVLPRREDVGDVARDDLFPATVNPDPSPVDQHDHVVVAGRGEARLSRRARELEDAAKDELLAIDRLPEPDPARHARGVCARGELGLLVRGQGTGRGHGGGQDGQRDQGGLRQALRLQLQCTWGPRRLVRARRSHPVRSSRGTAYPDAAG